VLADLAPRGILQLGGTRLTESERGQLARFRHGPGVYKVDWALDAPIPWTAEAGRRAMTVHVGGTLEDIARTERLAWSNQHAHDPFVIVTQPSIVDPTRAPPGHHTAWAYCHVPRGSTTSMVGPIENQIERFAPGFRARIIGRATRTAQQMETYNPNYVGGDINGGAQDLRQLWTRPTRRLNPYRTSDPRLFVCSSSTPPGGGVHGMCGFYAARAALGAGTNLIR
jgi:phytoene dehydrogenase-like protein